MSVVSPVTRPRALVVLARMIVVPVVSVVARPVLLIVATAWFVDVQVRPVVKGCVVPSVMIAVAVKARLSPAKAVGLLGATVT